MNALGYSTQTLDGVFGGNTRNALVAYQRDNGLSADGVVGCGTWTRIVNEVVGIGRTPPPSIGQLYAPKALIIFRT